MSQPFTNNVITTFVVGVVVGSILHFYSVIILALIYMILVNEKLPEMLGGLHPQEIIYNIILSGYLYFHQITQKKELINKNIEDKKEENDKSLQIMPANLISGPVQSQIQKIQEIQEIQENQGQFQGQNQDLFQKQIQGQIQPGTQSLSSSNLLYQQLPQSQPNYQTLKNLTYVPPVASTTAPFILPTAQASTPQNLNNLFRAPSTSYNVPAVANGYRQ